MLVCGKRGSGKVDVLKSLVASVVDEGLSPVVVDTDVGAPECGSIPGSLSAVKASKGSSESGSVGSVGSVVLSRYVLLVFSLCGGLVVKIFPVLAQMHVLDAWIRSMTSTCISIVLHRWLVLWGPTFPSRGVL